MAMKCVHKGCGKKFTDPDEPCHYHSGPPIFHEGQKGWKCCKPRVLTFDEFLSIPPCTTGKHSTVDDTPAPPPPKPAADPAAPQPAPNGGAAAPALAPAPRLPAAATPNRSGAGTPAPPEEDSDEEGATVPPGAACKRHTCGVCAPEEQPADRNGEKCTYHPGSAVFHEGSKGWTCCKRRVLEFDEFMKIKGCKTRERHCFVGKKGARRKDAGGDELEKVETVRHDFYQTPTTVHASLYLKKVDKEKSKIAFREDGSAVDLDLKTTDSKRYETVIPLYGPIKPGESSFAVKGTKVDLTLAKTDGQGWPVLRSDDRLTGEIIQTGRAGQA